jgi:hypothetical protein
MDVSSSLFPPGPLPGLKQLQLLDCDLYIDTLEQLFLLRGLTCLKLLECRIRPDVGKVDAFTYEEAEDWAEEFAEWLQQLTDLRSLTLHDICSPPYPEVLATFSTLTQLQHLDLDQDFDSFHGGDPFDGPITCPYLADSLTSLAFVSTRVEVSPATAPTFSRLTALQQLSMGRAARFDPSSLASVPQLRVLELNGCSLLEHAAGQPLPEIQYAVEFNLMNFNVQTTPLRGPEFSRARAQVAALFSQLMSLTRLESLTLSHIWGLKEQPLESFEALTASSNLTALRFEVLEENCVTSVGGLEIGEELDMPLPLGALQRMFPKGKQLPELQLLRIAYTGSELGVPLTGDSTDRHPVRIPTTYTVSARERAAIKAACPGLKDLQIQLT